MKSFKEFLLTEMPQYHKGEVIYQKDTKFREISKNNIETMFVIGEDVGFVYLVNSDEFSKMSFGYIFDKEDIYDKTKRHIRPVMSLQLREMDGIKQVFKLRIRESYSKANVRTSWYMNFLQEVGDISSDFDHLEGGKILWRSFINNPNLNTSLYDSEKHETVIESIPEDIDDWEIWSQDKSKRHLVIILSQS